MTTIISKPLLPTLLLALFVAVAIVGGPANRVETGLMQQLAEARADWPRLTGLVGGVTTLGGAYATLGVTCAASFWLLLRGAPARALLLALTVIAERLMVEGLKDWIGRPRPHFGIDWLPPSLAFPSGHSAHSMTAFLATALIAAPATRRGPWAMSALVLSVVVGLSRVYLGVHWPSDVIGGWALGLIAVSAAMMVGEGSGVLRFEPQHQIVGRHRPALGEDEAV